MWVHAKFHAIVLAAGLVALPAKLIAQEFTMRCDPPDGSLSRLNRTQKDVFNKSQDMFIASSYAQATAELRALLGQFPEDSKEHRALAVRAAEAAIYAGDRAYAIKLLKPIEQSEGSECPARTLLARAYAETGQSAERDAVLTALNARHNQDHKSSVGKLDRFLLEYYKLESGRTVSTTYCLRPFGPHNTYLYAGIRDPSGAVILIVELTSDDGDQVDFRASFPQRATKGERRYSLDAWQPNGSAPDTDMTHLPVIEFYDGRPSYDLVRERIRAIAEHFPKPPAATTP
jgi:hypothetical protein